MNKFIMLLMAPATIMVTNAQEPFDINSTLRPGTELTYSVSKGSQSYTITVTLTDKKGSAFRWRSGKPNNKSGVITNSAKGLKDALAFYLPAVAGNKKTDDKSVSFRLSDRICSYFNSVHDKPLKIYINGLTKPPVEMDQQGDGYEFKLKVNGKESFILHAAAFTMEKVGDEYEIAGNYDDIAYLDNAAFPLLISFKSAGSYIMLKEIRFKP